MGLLSFFSHSSSTRKSKLVKTELRFDRLEDRTVPATLILGTGGNLGLPHFSTLQAALGAAAAGDTILVEGQGVNANQAGSGKVSVATAVGDTSVLVDNVTTPFAVGEVVTLQGSTASTVIDAVAPTSTLGQFKLTLHNKLPAVVAAGMFVTGAFNTSAIDLNNLTITGDVQPGQTQVNANALGSLTVWAGASGVTISNLNTGSNILLQGTLTAAQTADSPVPVGATKATVNNDTVTGVTIGDGFNTNTISNSQIGFGGLTITGNTANKTGNGSNTITGNTVTGLTTVTGNTTGNTTGDTFSKNIFDETVTVTQDDGITFSNNTFTVAFADALILNATAKATVTGNSFTVTGPTAPVLNADRGIVVNQVAAANTVSANINANVFNDPFGTGVGFTILDGTKFSSNLFNNDFRATGTGVDILGDGGALATSLGTIDLGDATTPGDNVFRTFTKAQATAGSRSAIYVHNAVADPLGTVNAQGNIYDTGAAASDLIRDSKNNTAAAGIYAAATGVVNLGTAETATGGFVAGLYRVFLNRAADASGASFWASQLSSTSGVSVATKFVHTPESAGRIVDSLYTTILGRNADASGRAFWVSVLQAGGTVESVIVNFVSLPEFYNKVAAASSNPDGSYIQNLYETLLGRAASASDVSFWVGKLSTIGRAGVAQFFVTLPEFRSNYVTTLYGFGANVLVNPAGAVNVLHRTTNPTSSEINYWASTNTLDLLNVEAFFAGGPEGQSQL